ncbi:MULTISPECIES: ABC transporter substrate-binding protein [Cohaesibacter]|uniref:ABC transporter substrate-binding protein n=1 Tax=Cohaesibacter TaxID=655352 RepID=UPI000DEAB53B|nr:MULTISPECIES: ABC transporter substrate-binding protein [Cohaesibacter]TLP49146.1 carbohydrate ABC transporter substrate-binding protein [Cohaesibacter sp. CAU 1516]
MQSKFLNSAAILGLTVGSCLFGSAAAKAEDLTLCWAAWDPANALVELSKDFEAKSGHNMSFEFVPWPNFADRMLNELNSGGKLCDLMIGDSQWIGGAAENGHYVKLNDFFEKEGISMDDFIPATVTGYSEWPKNTPNYWALPAYADVVGWTYRKDWFERPELQKEFMEKYGYKLDAPETLEQLKQIGEFFQGREIDGKTVYGAAIYTERGSEGITMGVTNALYNYGFKYEDPNKPYELEGFVNSPEAVAGLEYYKSLYDCCTPPGSSDWYMSEDIDAYKSGQVAMQMNFAFIWPGVEADPNVGGGKSGYFSNPKGPGGHFAQLGGQGISVVSYSSKQDAALEYIKWFAQPEIQQKWWDAGGAPAFRAVVEAPDFAKSQPFAQTFLDSMAIVKDFWAEPAYADLLLAMQSRVHNYVIAEQGTAKEALDSLVKDWDEVFEDEGKK